jgi:hypothetical protein
MFEENLKTVCVEFSFSSVSDPDPGFWLRDKKIEEKNQLKIKEEKTVTLPVQYKKLKFFDKKIPIYLFI